GSHANQRLAGAGDRVRAVADLERLGRPGARDPDRAHAGRELPWCAPGRQTPGVAAAFRTRERRMGKIADVAERFWSGDLAPADRHPWAALHELEELDTGIAFVSTFANVHRLRDRRGAGPGGHGQRPVRRRAPRGDPPLVGP